MSEEETIKIIAILELTVILGIVLGFMVGVNFYNNYDVNHDGIVDSIDVAAVVKEQLKGDSK